MSIILDGMDQAKTYLPHFLQHTKSTSGMWKLRTHVTGVLVHGQMAYGFFDYGQFEHASNLTLTILLNVLYMYKDSLPQTLYIQMDKCVRENKNQYVLAFCCLLVELKVFTKIKLGFLMVGHTHEDVDQFFSRFSSRLSWNSAKTLPALMNHLEESYSPKPTSVLIDKIFKISQWLEPYIGSIRLHTGPHQYKIKLNEAGRARIQFKKWSTDEEWQTCDGLYEGVLLTGMPKRQPEPEFVNPKKVQGLEIEKLKSDYNSCASQLMDPKENDWWKDFFQQVDKWQGKQINHYIINNLT